MFLVLEKKYINGEARGYARLFYSELCRARLRSGLRFSHPLRRALSILSAFGSQITAPLCLADYREGVKKYRNAEKKEQDVFGTRPLHLGRFC